MADDIVAYIISRFKARLGADVCSPELMGSIASEVRRDYAGDRVYISSGDKRSRNAKIKAEWQAGKDTQQLAICYKLTERRIRQIIRIR